MKRSHNPSSEGRAPRTLYEAFDDPTGLADMPERTWIDAALEITTLFVAVGAFGVMYWLGCMIWEGL